MSLEEAGLVQRTPRPGGRGFDYRLTTAGEELRPENSTPA